MKFQAPLRCAAVTCGGQVLPIASDGSLHADEALAPLLRVHGIEPWRGRPDAPDRIACMTRAALVAALIKRGVRGPYAKNLASLRVSLRHAVATSDPSAS